MRRIEYIDTNKRRMSKKDFIEWVNNKRRFKNYENEIVNNNRFKVICYDRCDDDGYKLRNIDCVLDESSNNFEDITNKIIVELNNRSYMVYDAKTYIILSEWYNKCYNVIFEAMIGRYINY